MAYLKRMSFATTPVREDVLQKVKSGAEKARPPGYGDRLREITWNYLRNERGLPEVFTIVSGHALATLEMWAQLRELARYLYWASGFYLEKGEIDKAAIAARTAVNLGRQLEKDKTIIAVLVGTAIEAMGLAGLQEIYQELGNYEGREEIRFVKMHNHFWLREIRKHTLDMMRPLLNYFVFWGASFLSSFILFFWLMGWGSSKLFYYLVKRKGEKEYSILPIRKKTRFFVGLGLLIIGSMASVPVWVLAHIPLNPAIRLVALFLSLCLCLGFIKVSTPLLVRGELIYQGHKGSPLGAWLIAKNALFPFVKWGIMVYLLLMPIWGMFIAKGSQWLRTAYFNEVSLVPFPPHVNETKYSQEVSRLMEIVRAGKIYETNAREVRLDTEAIRHLGLLDAYEAVPELAEILATSQDEEVLERIIWAFGYFSQGVDPHLLKPFLNREGAITALGKIDHPESSRILLNYARKVKNLPEVNMKKEAALALALARQNQFEEASRMIEKIIRTEDEISYSTGIALALLPIKESRRLLNQYLKRHDYEYAFEIKEALRKSADGEIAGKMLQALISENKPLPSDLIEILSNRLNQSHIPLLIEGSQEKHHPSLRNFCLYILGRLKAKEAMIVVEKALTDSNWIVRVNAVGALGQIGDPSALPLLEKAKGDENLAVQAAVAWSLAKLRED